MLLLKAKHQYKLKNRMGKRTAAQKMKELGSAGAHGHASLTTVRGKYHGPTVVASGRYGSVGSSTLRFELRLGSLDSPWIPCIGPIGLVLLLS